MLEAQPKSKVTCSSHRMAIIAARYNPRYVEGMLAAAVEVLNQAGLPKSNVAVLRVPGSFEIPAVAAKLAAIQERRYHALICLGVILRGETSHADHIGRAVSLGLAEIQVRFQLPVIHEVLVLDTEDQAKARCLNPDYNRGREAAHTAISMAELMAQIDRDHAARR